MLAQNFLQIHLQNSTASDCNVCTIMYAYPFILCQLLAGHQHTKHSTLASAQHTFRQKQAASGGPDISQLRPDLQAEWMHDRNKHLGSIAVKPHSSIKAWWSCPSCPDGHAHIWEARVGLRSDGTGCPCCSGKQVCKHNSLATKAPEVVRYWHPQRNLPLSPDTITARSCFRAHWLCSACNYEWQALVFTKVRRNRGCPRCARANSGRSKDGVRQRHPTFASCKHHILLQWDHSLNEMEGNYPDNTSLQSSKPIWWTCDQCPRGKKHSWQATPGSRACPRPCGCPYCAGQKVCECNSLQTLQPDLAADFDTAANGLSPIQITAYTGTKYRWLSDQPGSKLRSPAQRSNYTRAMIKLAKRMAAS